MSHCLHQVRRLEGQHVTVALANGSTVGDCTLVSAGRGRTTSLWLVCQGNDLFVPLSDIVDVSRISHSDEPRAA
jgi:hypothetical protein